MLNVLRQYLALLRSNDLSPLLYGEREARQFAADVTPYLSTFAIRTAFRIEVKALRIHLPPERLPMLQIVLDALRPPMTLRSVHKALARTT